MAEINDDIALRWALRDVLAKRHHFMRVSDEKLVMLAERRWIKMEEDDVVVTDASRAELFQTIMTNERGPHFCLLVYPGQVIPRRQ